jgi:hypothetical protein
METTLFLYLFGFDHDSSMRSLALCVVELRSREVRSQFFVVRDRSSLFQPRLAFAPNFRTSIKIFDGIVRCSRSIEADNFEAARLDVIDNATANASRVNNGSARFKLCDSLNDSISRVMRVSVSELFELDILPSLSIADYGLIVSKSGNVAGEYFRKKFVPFRSIVPRSINNIAPDELRIALPRKDTSHTHPEKV